MAAFPFATAERFASLLDNPDMARLWLAGLGVRDAERGFATSATWRPGGCRWIGRPAGRAA